MTFQVPIVDISPYAAGGTPAERSSVAAAVDDACTKVGFVQVLGHGIPESVIDGLTNAQGFVLHGGP